MHFESTDQNIAPFISRTLSQRAKTIEHFFGKPFAKKFEVRILANRAALNTYWASLEYTWPEDRMLDGRQRHSERADHSFAKCLV